jgi:transcription elongation GreA/GreB family factor
MTLKEKLYRACEKFIETRHKNIENQINQVQAALLEETKSSAGDKHETGRAMLQLEQEKLGSQLLEAQRISAKLTRINLQLTSDKVTLGSIVYSSQVNYFIAISAGQIEINGVNFFAISPETPIGQLLLNKKADESVKFRGQNITLTKIL